LFDFEQAAPEEIAGTGSNLRMLKLLSLDIAARDLVSDRNHLYEFAFGPKARLRSDVFFDSVTRFYRDYAVPNRFQILFSLVREIENLGEFLEAGGRLIGDDVIPAELSCFASSERR
jgi:hypothetical protein